MAESDFVYMISEYTNRLWVLQAWWLSVAMGLFTLAYFVGHKLGLAALVFVLAAFTAFTYFQVSQLTRLGANIDAALSSLAQIDSEGESTLSPLSEQLFTSYDASSLEVAANILYFPLLYLGAVVYLVLRYAHGRKAAESAGAT